MATDAAAIVLALGASYVATLKGGPRSTFGLHRAEMLAALVNAVVLLVVCGYLLYAGISRLRRPEPVDAGPMIAFARSAWSPTASRWRSWTASEHGSLNLRGAVNEVLRRPARVAARRDRRHRHLDHGLHRGRLRSPRW